MPTKNYSLLAQQPLGADLCGDPQRDDIVVSALVDERGERHILSRFGDGVWELSPFFTQANIQAGCKRINWSRVPMPFRSGIKAVLYRYWVAGVPGWGRPSAPTLTRTLGSLLPFLRYLDEHKITVLSQVQALHVHNFLKAQHEAGRDTTSMEKYRTVIGLLYRFRGEQGDGLTFDPWPDESRGFGSGRTSQKVARTRLIPREVVRDLFSFAERILGGADVLLDERDAGRGAAMNDPELLRIRNACFFLMGLLTGMRCEEIAGIEVNANYTEVKDDVTYHWVKSIEHKTKKGRVEYLMPSMGIIILRVMERWSEPLRALLREQLTAWQAEGDVENAQRLQQVAAAGANATRLFLGIRTGFTDIAAIAGSSWNTILRRFAADAGVEWALAPHQLRRTYAWTYVQHRLGNMLFLKEQFKHSSMAMTQLYAANPCQDPKLYEEILSEVRDRKVGLIQHWLGDGIKLSGGAGRKIIALRANAFENRTELIEDTAQSVHIRSNGHAWCLAQDDGCGGAGLYERTRCAGCSSGCIDDSHAPIWREIYAHQLELAEDAKELGAGAQQRVERDRRLALQVLTDLGITSEEHPSR